MRDHGSKEMDMVSKIHLNYIIGKQYKLRLSEGRRRLLAPKTQLQHTKTIQTILYPCHSLSSPFLAQQQNIYLIICGGINNCSDIFKLFLNLLGKLQKKETTPS